MSKSNWPLVGNQRIVDYLETVIENDTLNHAYLFYGASGLGKTLAANYFIQKIFCEAKSQRPCGSCVHCRQILKKVHPDIIYLACGEDKKNITVEQIREVRSKLQRGSFLNSHKVALIKEANSLSLAASNAMLKILEEPTKKTIFIFLSTDLNNIPATILSRLQTIKFLPVAMSEIENHLKNIGKSKDEAYELARLSAGFPGRIIPLTHHPKLLTEYKKEIETTLSALMGDINSRFGLVERLAAQDKSQQAKKNSRVFLANLSALIRDCLLIKNMLFDKVVHLWLATKLSTLASSYSSAQLSSILTKIKETDGYIEKNVNLRLALENLVLEF